MGTFGRMSGLGVIALQRRVPGSAASGADLFEATIGGLGLTGIVEWAEIRLEPIASSFLEAETFPMTAYRILDAGGSLDRRA